MKKATTSSNPDALTPNGGAESSTAVETATPSETKGLRTGPEDSGFYLAEEIRILVIDDETVVGNLVRFTLEQPQIVVDLITQGDRIEAALKDGGKYHLVIMDYVVPGLTAEVLFGWLKKHQPEASVIVITGFPSLESVVSSLRAHVYDYVTKPFQPEQLKKVVFTCLENRGLLRQSEVALRENLGSSIRERRKAQALTLAQMETKTGISLGYLSQIELGKNSASIETLYRICLALGIKMSELFASIKA
jgi:DNA-binding response OmpR family regulator